jgi:hypothetical protein
MKKLERIQDEMLTLLILILTLTFTSSNFNPKLSAHKSLAEILPHPEEID